MVRREDIGGEYVPWIVGEAEVASNDVLEEALRRLGGELLDHVSEDAANSIEPRGSGANVAQTNIIEEDLRRGRKKESREARQFTRRGKGEEPFGR